MPSLNIPIDLGELVIWVQLWAAAIGVASVPVIDKIKEAREDISSTKTRWLSWVVPPAIAVFLYVVGLLLGMVALSGPWAGALLLIAASSLFYQRPAYAAKESFKKAPAQTDQNEGAMDSVPRDSSGVPVCTCGKRVFRQLPGGVIECLNCGKKYYAQGGGNT